MSAFVQYRDSIPALIFLIVVEGKGRKAEAENSALILALPPGAVQQHCSLVLKVNLYRLIDF